MTRPMLRAVMITPLGAHLLLAAVQVAGQATADTLTITAADAPHWDDPVLVEELRIGSLSGEVETSFGEVTGVVEGIDGVIWVADGMQATIRRFNPDGSYLDSVGRRGEGPGEFTGGMHIGLKRLDDGRVVAFDVHGRRITFFDPDGAYLDSWPLPVGCITSVTPSLTLDPEGTLYLRSCLPARGGRIWVATDLDGAVLDTMIVPLADAAAPAARSLPFGTMSPFIPKTVSAMSPEGYLVTARTDEYALHWPLADGRVVRLTREWEPIPVHAEERDQFRDHYERSARRFQAMGVRTDPPFRAIPDEKPPFWAIQVDDLGRFWVARHQPAVFEEETEGERSERMRLNSVPGAKMEWSEPLVTDVLEPNGRFLGTIEFPSRRSTIAGATEDALWVIELGDFDEQYVVRYRIEGR